MSTKLPTRFILFICILLVVACQSKTGHFPKISGHRGASFIAPENTLASIDSCIKYKVDLAECDVCISKDSVFYLLHDSTLDRTTNGSGAIANWMSYDIDTLDAGSWFNPVFKGVRVPRLEDALRRAKQGKLELTIDYRNGNLKRMLDLIRREGMLDHCTFVFYSEDDFKAFRKLAPQVKRLQAYIRTNKDFDYVIDSLKPDIAVVRLDSITPQWISRCHEAGMKVLALALKSSAPDEDYIRAARLGVDVIATDRPEYIIKKFVRR